MFPYLLRRILHALLILLGAFTFSFILLQVMPGDAITVKFQDPDLGLTPQQIAEIRLSYGADGSRVAQYFHTLTGMLRGDFGYSVQQGVPVSTLLRTTLPVTLRLAAFSFVVAILEAMAIAFLATALPFAFLRRMLAALPGFLGAIPVFWFGIALIQFLSFKLRLVPVVGAGPYEAMILPTLAISLPIGAPLAQVLLGNLDEIAARPFVAVVRTKGAGALWTLFHHVAPNAILPFLTISGLVFGELLAGAVVTETIFGLNGIGQLTQQAVAGQDVAVLQAVVMISAAAYVLINLTIDLVYPLFDPRIHLQGRTMS